MDSTAAPAAPHPARAWLPLTPGGIAAFARASAFRFVLMLLVVGFGLGGTMVWAVYRTWWPALDQAVAALPATGEINGSRLVWPTNTVQELADDNFLALVVNPTPEPLGGQTADLQIEFGRRTVRVESLFGYFPLPYPANWIIALNRPTLEPIWGAWQPELLAAVWLMAAVGAPLFWALLALGLAPVVQGYARLFRRPLRYGTAWRLVCASFVPSSVLLAVAGLCYAYSRLSFPGLLLLGALQCVVVPLYLLIAPFRLPRPGETSPFAVPERIRTSGNPFATATAKKEPRPAKPQHPVPPPPDDPDAPQNPS